MLFVGDDWAEDHHDVEVQDATGRRLAKARLPEGLAGITRLHELVGAHLAEDAGPDQVVVGIETDRGPWVSALVAAGYQVIAVNPVQAARYRERYSTSGAKSDAGDAHALADMVRTDRHQLRPVAGDSDLADAVKIVARSHQTLVWDRTRQVQRLRAALVESFPATLAAFDDLDAADTLELLGKAPTPAAARRLTVAQLSAALKRARRRDIAEKSRKIRAAFQAAQPPVRPATAAAYGAVVRAQVGLIGTLNAEIDRLGEQVEAHFGQHPDAEIYRSQPGLGTVLAARVLAEFGDDPKRYAHAKARKNYAGTSPITRASGKKTVVMARYARNDRLADALHQQAFCALNASPGARAYYDTLRARGTGHHAALRQLANRLVGILHGCLKTRTPYNEATAWPQTVTLDAAA
ncbi:IS110 family transposase [Frankia sp. AvcI1]|uniref:IS110 family transposase n=1 Tax=Frankia sp. AvcI1 TaxID=573496 RepID=UPI0006EC2923|nr:IS110 family transposase [Frankia sp. AvcI1]